MGGGVGSWSDPQFMAEAGILFVPHMADDRFCDSLGCCAAAAAWSEFAVRGNRPSGQRECSGVFVGAKTGKCVEQGFGWLAACDAQDPQAGLLLGFPPTGQVVLQLICCHVVGSGQAGDEGVNGFVWERLNGSRQGQAGSVWDKVE